MRIKKILKILILIKIFEFEDSVRSPGWIRYQKKIKMIQKRLNNLKKKFENFGIDGYVVPKNDDFFSEYSNKDRLSLISNFSGSAGYAVILKEKKLFICGWKIHSSSANRKW